jgi:plastocyanin
MHLLKSAAAAALVSLLLAAPALAADHKVVIQNFKFSPATLSVKAGDTVTFTNQDSAPHTATASNGAFDTGRISKGQSKRVTISTKGAIAYICSFHPMMKARITAK